MNKPLFDIRLKIWENWNSYKSSMPWFIKKLADKQYGDIGVTRFVAGAFDPHNRVVHLYLDEIGKSSIANLEAESAFTNRNYQLEFGKEFVTTLIHELIHSADVFSSEKDNEEHNINEVKLRELILKSSWYAELVRICHTLSGSTFNITDPNKELDSSQDYSE